jgi:hypothetical protein
MYEDIEATEINKSHFNIVLKAMVRSIGVAELRYCEAFKLHSGMQGVF